MMVKGNDFDSAYRRWLENLKEIPPPDVWDHIQNELDVEDVWRKLSPTLDSYRGVPVSTGLLASLGRPGRLLLAVVVLMVLTTPLSERGQFPVQAVTGKMVGRSTPGTTHQLPSPPASQPRETNEPADGETKKLEAVSPGPEPDRVSEPATADLRRVPARGGVRFQTVHVLPPLAQPEAAFTIPKRVAVNVPLANGLETDDDNGTTSPRRRKRFEVGAVANVSNTWLLNQETLSGLGSDQLLATVMTFGHEWGGVVALPVGKDADILLAFYTVSRTGQQYRQYINAFYQKRQITLQYNKFEVLFRTPLIRSDRFLSLYGLLGGYYATLDRAEEVLGEYIQDVAAQYTPTDYGITFGVDTEIPITPRLSAYPGLRGSYSTHNIFSGNDRIPAHLKKTNSAAVGFSFSVRYKL